MQCTCTHAGKWEFEVGEEAGASSASGRSMELCGMSESSSNPICVRRDTRKAFAFRIRNMPYPLDTYDVRVEDAVQMQTVTAQAQGSLTGDNAESGDGAPSATTSTKSTTASTSTAVAQRQSASNSASSQSSQSSQTPSVKSPSVHSQSPSAHSQGQEIVVRTKNRKYFKRLRIADFARLGVRMEQSRLQVSHAMNTLLVTYEKPPPILLVEQGLWEQLRASDTKKEGDVQVCNPS